MDFFQPTASIYLSGSEEFLREATGITLCETNSNNKSNFYNGTFILTSHRLFWRDIAGLFILCTELKNIKSVHADPERTQEGLPRLVFKFEGEKSVKAIFGNHGSQLYLNYLETTLHRKRWEIPQRQPNPIQSVLGSGGLSSMGISAVQKKMQMEQKTTDAQLKAAFADIEKLMSSAQEMVGLSRKLADKIRDGQGAISADETVEFKSLLLSMGIANPVTKQTAGSLTKYHKELCKELATFLQPLIQKEPGGTMALADVYCRFNRARGVDLVSPDDILIACEQFGDLKLPLVLRRYSSGVIVVQLSGLSDEAVVEETLKLLEDRALRISCLTAEDLARSLGISVTLAKERLLLCEQKGKLCRDENVEGLKFYPNKFLMLA